MTQLLAIILGLALGSLAAHLHLHWLHRELRARLSRNPPRFGALARRASAALMIVLPAGLSPVGAAASLSAFWLVRTWILRGEVAVDGS